MLVYEHVINGSLDKYLFDNATGTILNWEQRYNIILGIAKGILYLHEDSRIKMIHRDLKANNILLDENMNPKVADFGLARLFGGDHTQTKTAHVVGTYGYMAPEYVMFGNVSTKTDVFSFGVLLLEIVTGRRNGSSDDANSDVCHLITDVWNYWIQGRALQLVQQSQHEYSESKALRCIHIGLLCVQQNPNERPEISSVVLMLTRSRIELQTPRQPAFFFGNDAFNGMAEENFSVNNVTNTDPCPR
ncbi:hypothetical protein PR202_ga29713 [Eleusine coracana subsp. coracana]|uniref:Protein kinase domain-containing protein n=1 Tax=Eleusine coracana subsp. coracana TaxID=191504 RepID=A0AAV5DLJ7_ELECO|nr:hypothetical protein PR202_ga29713 [Eleusine coracana subsp. coracana]